MIGSLATRSATFRQVVEIPITRIEGEASVVQQDSLAIEEPLEIRLGYGPADRRTHKAISITMRTPGHDFELAAGFLLGEGIVRQAADIASMHHCGISLGANPAQNIVRVELHPRLGVELERLERHFYTTSSCGVCGKTSLAALQTAAHAALPREGLILPAAIVHGLPARLREAQSVFDQTGGLHAAALFDAAGTLHGLREDVGRHNAVDKLIGAQFLEGRVPLHDRVIMVSGRASFELMQKSLMAGIPILAAVGAPSSLAVDLARQFDMTLLGFVRNNRFNIYNGHRRIAGHAGNP